MSNPYESPGEQHTNSYSPIWYYWFYELQWPCVLLGVVLAVGTWTNVVPENLGWAGCLAAMAMWLAGFFSPATLPEFVVLDSRALKNRGPHYQHVLKKFGSGAHLLFDGALFSIYEDGDLRCAITSAVEEITYDEALNSADEATGVYEQLREQSEEFAVLVRGCRLVIFLHENFESEAICTIIDGKVNWQAS